MAIEKAFAINAAPDEIYAALERDLAEAEAESGTFEVLERHYPRSISLRVTMGGIPCWLIYRIEPQDGGPTEVVASLTPFGIKYLIFRIITFGLREQDFAMALVQGLSNLKAEVEGEAPLDETSALPDGTEDEPQ